MAMKSPEWLATAQYIDLVTYKKVGTPVSSPLWFAVDEQGRLVAYSDGSSGKVKRLRNSSRVEVAPCTMRGKRVGPGVAGTAELLPLSMGPVVHGQLNKKYGWKKHLFELGSKIGYTLKRKPANPEAFIAITLTES
jgi:uncharacterized protein